jgi:hypothetical protein
LDLWNSTGSALTWLHKQFLSDASIAIPSGYMEDGLPRELAKSICVSTFKNHITHLTLDIAKPIALEVQRDIKLTFPDMLGIIGITKQSSLKFQSMRNKTSFIICLFLLGGTIGLCTGLSLISVVEFIYWIYLTVVDYFSLH